MPPKKVNRSGSKRTDRESRRAVQKIMGTGMKPSKTAKKGPPKKSIIDRLRGK